MYRDDMLGQTPTAYVPPAESVIFQPGPEEDPYYGTPFAADAPPAVRRAAEQRLASQIRRGQADASIPGMVTVTPRVPLTPSQQAAVAFAGRQGDWTMPLLIGGGALLLLMMLRR